MNTSVFISAGFIPGPFQKEPVSLSKRLTFTSQSSFFMASRFFPALEPLHAGFWPQAKKPLISSLYMASKRSIQEYALPSSTLGSQLYPNSFSFAAFSPKKDLRRLTEYLG